MSASRNPRAAATSAQAHRVVIVCSQDVIAFDVACVVETLRWTTLPDGRPAYDVVTAGPEPLVRSTSVALALDHGLEAVEGAGTVVVPGRVDPTAAVAPAVVEAVRAAHGRGSRLVSVCVGAFDLAATGLLDGRRATTHWRAAAQLAHRFPRVCVDPDALWVDEGDVLTSAGATAGVDLCLHLVERDHGTAAALQAARAAVVPLVRAGGQAQYTDHAPARRASTLTSPLGPVLAWVEDHLHEPLSLAVIAGRANESTRSLTRRFERELGTTPMAWVSAGRVRLARALLETTDLPLTQVAARTGMGSTSAFRAHFARASGTTPSSYRRAFRIYGTDKQPTVLPRSTRAG